MTARVPERLSWAVAQLPPAVDGPVLEIGCGSGLAAALLLDRYPDAAVTGIDRSDAAIARARARLATPLAEGRLRLDRLDLATAARTLDRGRFGLALAVNVNVFWTAPGDAFRAAAALLAPRGRLVLVYEPPTARRLDALRTTIPALVERHGLHVVDVRHARLAASHALCVVAAAGGRPTRA